MAHMNQNGHAGLVIRVPTDPRLTHEAPHTTDPAPRTENAKSRPTPSGADRDSGRALVPRGSGGDDVHRFRGRLDGHPSRRHTCDRRDGDRIEHGTNRYWDRITGSCRLGQLSERELVAHFTHELGHPYVKRVANRGEQFGGCLLLAPAPPRRDNRARPGRTRRLRAEYGLGAGAADAARHPAGDGAESSVAPSSDRVAASFTLYRTALCCGRAGSDVVFTQGCKHQFPPCCSVSCARAFSPSSPASSSRTLRTLSLRIVRPPTIEPPHVRPSLSHGRKAPATGNEDGGRPGCPSCGCSATPPWSGDAPACVENPAHTGRHLQR
ncbi:hypothetical protein SFIMM107S_00772 [Streptomyces griseus]